MVLAEVCRETSVGEVLPNAKFRRALKVRDVLGEHTVHVLDEKILSNSGGTVHMRQFILGQFDGAFAGKWKRHWGWQGAESIREFYRRTVDASDEVVTREYDVSNRKYTFS